MKITLSHISFLIIAILCVCSLTQVSAQKLKKRIYYNIGLNTSPLGYYVEGNYKLNSDFDASLRYESDNYCFLCGLGENNGVGVSDVWGMRQFALSGVFKREMGDFFSISFGPQYIIGFPWYGNRFSGHKTQSPSHRFGILLGMAYGRFNIRLARRLPRILNNGEWQFSFGVLIGDYSRD